MALYFEQRAKSGSSQQPAQRCLTTAALAIAARVTLIAPRESVMIRGQITAMIISIVASTPLYAREGQPLTIDNLMVETNRVDVELSLSQLDYAGLSGRSLLARTQWGARSDLNITGSYGVSDWQAVPGSESSYTGLDFSWQMLEEGSSPALLLSASATRIDGPADQRWQMGLGATLWRSIDPVVLSLSMSGFKIGDTQQEPSTQYVWELVPRINFAVNPDITLVSGWRYRSGLQVNQSASWGLAWAVATDLQIFVEHELETGAMGGSRFDLRFRYRLR